jgi:iron complex transport system substrate-binding protein
MFFYNNILFRWLFGPALIIAVLLYGCEKPSAPPTRADKTSAGEMRVVSLSPNLTEILFALGLDEEIVGVTRHCNYPSQANLKHTVGTFWQPNVEAIMAARPTKVIGETFEQQHQLTEQLERISCKTLAVRIERVSQLNDGIMKIGRAVDRCEQAEALVSRLTEAKEALVARYAGRTCPKVLWVIQRQPLRVAGTETFVNDMIELAGGVNAIGPTVNVYPPISAEEVIAAWPDVIIEPTDTPDALESQACSATVFYAAFRTIPAVKNGHIYVLDGDLVSRLGPRLDQGLSEIARCLWQE